MQTHAGIVDQPKLILTLWSWPVTFRPQNMAACGRAKAALKRSLVVLSLNCCRVTARINTKHTSTQSTEHPPYAGRLSGVSNSQCDATWVAGTSGTAGPGSLRTHTCVTDHDLLEIELLQPPAMTLHTPGKSSHPADHSSHLGSWYEEVQSCCMCVCMCVYACVWSNHTHGGAMDRTICFMDWNSKNSHTAIISIFSIPTPSTKSKNVYLKILEAIAVLLRGSWCCKIHTIDSVPQW